MALSTYTARDKRVTKLVRQHFKTGIHELESLAQCLHKAEEGPNVYMEVREHIERASKHLAQAEAMTQAELEKVDSQCEELMMKKKKLQGEKKAKSESLKALKIQRDTSERLREENTAALKRINNVLSQTQQRQAIAENEVENQRSRRTAALWSMLIPVVGTIIGGGVAITSQIALTDAEEQVAVMEKTITEYRSNVVKHSKEVEKYSKLVEEDEASIRGNEKRILDIEALEENRMKLHNQTLQLQEVLRCCTHFLGMLAGKTHIADTTTKYVCDYENLRCILEDMEQQVLPLLGTESIETQRLELLSSPEITNTIQSLKRLS